MHYYCINIALYSTQQIAVQIMLSLADSDHGQYTSASLLYTFVDLDGKLRSYLQFPGEFLHASPVISIGIHTTGNLMWGWKIFHSFSSPHQTTMPGLKQASDNRQGFSQLMWCWWLAEWLWYMCWHVCFSCVSQLRLVALNTPLTGNLGSIHSVNNLAGLKLKPWTSETITRPSFHTTYRTWLTSCSPCTEQNVPIVNWG